MDEVPDDTTGVLARLGPTTGPDPTARRVYEILVREHTDMLTAYLRSLVADPGTVDDLFQETMLVAWRRLGDFDRSRPFAPWLRGIAAMLVLAHRRKGAASHIMACEPAVLEELERQFASVGRRPGDSFRERAERLHACIERLPDTLRDVIEMAYARGMMLKQIADALGTGEEAIKKRVQRAREALAQCFLAEEVSS